MIVITIESTDVAAREGISEKTGKPWKMVYQQILITGHFVDGFAARHPRESTIQLDEKSPAPYPLGQYVISPESFYFGDFGRFTLGRIKLQRLDTFLEEAKHYMKKVA